MFAIRPWVQTGLGQFSEDSRVCRLVSAVFGKNNAILGTLGSCCDPNSWPAIQGTISAEIDKLSNNSIKEDLKAQNIEEIRRCICGLQPCTGPNSSGSSSGGKGLSTTTLAIGGVAAATALAAWLLLRKR